MGSCSEVVKVGRVEFNQPVRYAISDRNAIPELDLGKYIESLFSSSADMIQWRERDLDASINREMVRTGVRFSKDTSRLFIVNSDLELALNEGADGLHLTSDQELTDVLDAVGSGRDRFIIGKSAHSVEAAVAAEAEGADYVTLSPVYEPYSKESGHDLLGLTALRSAAQILSIPVFALGGVDLKRIDVVCAAGAAGIAGITWVVDEIVDKE